MKGSIRQRGQTHTAYWFTVDPGTGKRKQHSKGGFRTKRVAQEHLNDVLGTVQTGAWAPDKKITVCQLLTEWLAAKKSQGLRATTLSQYQNVVDSWLVPHVGAVQLAKLSPSQTQQLVETLRTEGSRTGGALSARSVQLSVTVLKAATAWALETGLVGRDPLAGYRRPRAQAAKGAGAAWTVEEARAFLCSVTEDRLSAAWALLLTRGLRRGELAGLRWDTVDLDGGSVQITRTRVLVDGAPVDSVPKTDAGRRPIPLDPSLVGSLRSHKTRQGQERWAAGEAWGDEGYVFTDELGAPLHPEFFSTRFETLVDRAKLRRIRLHDTRHTAASLMLASGENVKVVAELLGHSSPTITQTIYQHVMRGCRRAPAKGSALHSSQAEVSSRPDPKYRECVFSRSFRLAAPKTTTSRSELVPRSATSR
jgi:integrase